MSEATTPTTPLPKGSDARCAPPTGRWRRRGEPRQVNLQTLVLSVVAALGLGAGGGAVGGANGDGITRDQVDRIERTLERVEAQQAETADEVRELKRDLRDLERTSGG